MAILIPYLEADETKLAGIASGANVNNISDVNATDLTDGGETTLHTHPSAVSNPPRLDAYLSTDLSVDLETETILQIDTVENALDMSLSSGEVTFSVGGRYGGHIVLSVDEDRDPITYIWLEKKPFATGVWELFNNMICIKIKEDGTYILPGDMEVEAGDIIRIKIYFTKSDASLDLVETSLIVTLGTLIQPSVSISITKTGEVTP